MTTTAPPPERADLGPPSLRHSALAPRRRITNRVALVAITLALVVAVVPLAWVTVSVLARGFQILSWQFLTEDIPNSYRRHGPGMAPAIVGTFLITGMAALLAVPLGVFGAIYLNEYGKQKPLAQVIRTMADVMTGVPSIVMGLFF